MGELWAVEAWLVAELMGGSCSCCCCALDWAAPTFAAISYMPVTPTARSVAEAIAVLMNSRLFILSHDYSRGPRRPSPRLDHACCELMGKALVVGMVLLPNPASSPGSSES